MQAERIKKKRRHRRRTHRQKIKPLVLTLGILSLLAGMITLMIFLNSRHLQFAQLSGIFLTLGVLLLCIAAAMKHMDGIEKE